jgi:hypothetical protein
MPRAADDGGDGGDERNASDDFLHDVWTWYFHDPDDADWTFPSYQRLADSASMSDFWTVQTAVEPFLTRGMFFVMRESVYPCWDDEANMRGGCLSMKVLKDELPAFWAHMVQHVLGESIVRTGESDIVNGLSVSPKRFFSIVKLWLRDDTRRDGREFVLPPGYSGEVLFRLNVENIRNNNGRMVRSPTVAVEV